MSDFTCCTTFAGSTQSYTYCTIENHRINQCIFMMGVFKSIFSLIDSNPINLDVISSLVKVSRQQWLFFKFQPQS